MMDTHYKNFVNSFCKLLFDLNRYHTTPALENAIKMFEQFDMAKLIFGTSKLLKTNIEMIQNKNEVLFTKPFMILPDVDLSLIWNKLASGQKSKVWTYLNMLQVQSDIIMVCATTVTTEKEVVKEVKKPVEFNPYVGTMELTGNCTNYGVDEMFSAVPEEDDEDGPGLESVIKLFGIDKMIDFNGISEQLKNLNMEDIESATNNIKEMLGDTDEGTSQLINDMLTDLKDELKTKNLSEGDPLKNIMSVAGSVAEKLKPNVENGNIDLTKLLNSTQKFSENLKDKDGNQMFPPNMNPFNMLTQMTAGLNNGTVNEDQCMQQCNNMMQNMGLNPAMVGMMSQMMAGNNRAARRGNNKKQQKK